MIPFCKATNSKRSVKYVNESIKSSRISGDNSFTLKCHKWFEEKFLVKKALLTTSCTHALEMTAILCNIKDGDEVIMPSYTFVSTANAFVLRGAKIVFVDIRRDTMNIDENLIESAITQRTKAIVPVHYAGVACEMDKIMQIAKKYNLYVIEDAAQAMMSEYKGKKLGTIGDFGCISFHETKNYTMGEGGLLMINSEKFIKRAEIIREKGTNRSQFFRGEVDKYSWVDLGSSYLPSDINAAYLYAQLEEVDKINNNRIKIWNYYKKELLNLEKIGHIETPNIPELCKHNAHIFYIKVKNLKMRSNLINYLKDNGIGSVFHYVPLHTSKTGKLFSRFCGEDIYTSSESDRLIRLPLYYSIKKQEIKYITSKIYNFFNIF